MAKQSAGILAYRIVSGAVEVLLVHPGGPFFVRKDTGAWTIPKGEINEGEDPFAAAKREFLEETGIDLKGEFTQLTTIKQKGGKVVHAWAICQDIDTSKIVSNTFELEWPARSGRMKTYPEIDKAEWFEPEAAQEKINAAQAIWIDEVINLAKGHDA